MWANLHLLFWLSLVPVATGWIGDNPHAPWPVAFYGMALFMTAMAWFILERTLIGRSGANSELARAVGSEFKGKVSSVLYAAAIALAFVRPWIAEVLYAVVALLWVVPDPRIESRVVDE
jgi:uncharacterized membrane protein